MTTAFVFPGQGSQAVGMGKELAEALPEARAVFEEVDEALGLKLSEIMWEGPADTLTLTENAQPALMAVSVAVARVIAKAGFVYPTKFHLLPVIRWESIRHLLQQALSRLRTLHACCSGGVRLCSARCPLAMGLWRRFWVQTSISRKRS